MPDPQLLALLTPIAQRVISDALSGIGLDRRGKRILMDRMNEGLLRHMNFVYNATSQIQFMGMTDPKGLMPTTIPLNLGRLPRRFGGTARDVTEADVLRAEENTLILGDPGSGKTTIVKRLAQMSLGAGDDLPLRVPILIECRAYDWKQRGLQDRIAEVFNVPDPLPPELAQRHNRRETVTAFLERLNALLVIDGVDEVDEAAAEEFYRELRWLGLNSPSLRTIATCRSGAHRHLESFIVRELRALDRDQIAAIVEAWLPGRSANFLSQVRGPLLELVGRPLFLAQLMVVYDHGGNTLPAQPAQLYRQMTRLLLEKWDEERGVHRSSRYSHFDSKEKERFLAHPSFFLTVEAKSIRFSRADLVRAYDHIAADFSLPLSEENEVAQELETHTGIIVRSGENFEFSHLTLQEHLCGSHMLKSAGSSDPGIVRYVHEYPEPVAVAIALSSDPSQYFIDVMRRGGHFYNPSIVRRLCSRLVVERPHFLASDLLGHALMKLAVKCGREGERELLALLESSELQRSLRAVAHLYAFREELPGHYGVRPYIRRLATFRRGWLPASVAERALGRNGPEAREA